jgi:hypothetical protein
MFVYISTNEYGDVAAATLPGSACSASATLPDGSRIDLPAQNANDQGLVVWSYPAKSPAPMGQGFHTVSCRSGALSASSFAYFDIGS